MRTLIGFAFLLASAAYAAEPVAVPIVLYPGMEATHTTAAPLLTVKTVPPNRAVTTRFDQYGQTVRLTGRALGEATVLCEYADNRVGEILAVSVVRRQDYERHHRAALALSYVDGIAPGTIHIVGNRLVIGGTTYSVGALRRCIELEGRDTVCTARLASAAAVVHPDHGYLPRASVELIEKTGAADSSGPAGSSMPWTAVVRFGDVPVFEASASQRHEVLNWTVSLASRLNDIAERVRGDAETGRPYPVAFRIRPGADRHQIVASWNYEQGSGGETLLTVPEAPLQAVGAEAGAEPTRMLQWWMALLQDAFRAYVLAERPIRSSSSTASSPLLVMYEGALRLHRGDLNVDNAAIGLARSYFALQFAGGGDPFTRILRSVPADFIPAAP